jgi:hypothetical protein
MEVTPAQVRVVHIRVVAAGQGRAVVRNPPDLPPPRRHRPPLLLRPRLLPRRRPPQKVRGTKDSRDRTDDQARRIDGSRLALDECGATTEPAATTTYGRNCLRQQWRRQQQ